MSVGVLQPSLFGGGTCDFDDSFRGIERTDLAAGAWIERIPNWLAGEQTLFDDIVDSANWQAVRRPMYDRIVDVPRLTATLTDETTPSVLRSVREVLAERYEEPLETISLAYYRDGNDSVAPHGDQIARGLDTTIMATVSVGAPRRFVLHRQGEPTVAFDLGSGDLLVMGGTVQRTWTHAVPKTTRPVGPRICVMFRPPWLG